MFINKYREFLNKIKDCFQMTPVAILLISLMYLLNSRYFPVPEITDKKKQGVMN